MCHHAVGLLLMYAMTGLPQQRRCRCPGANRHQAISSHNVDPTMAIGLHKIISRDTNITLQALNRMFGRVRQASYALFSLKRLGQFSHTDYAFCRKRFTRALDPHAKDGMYSRDRANISNSKVSRRCLPLTANRTSADCMENTPGPPVQHIQMGVYHTGGFSAM